MDESTAKRALKVLEDCIEALAGEIGAVENCSPHVMHGSGETAAIQMLRSGMHPVPNMSVEAEHVLRELAVKLPVPPITEEAIKAAMRTFAEMKESVSKEAVQKNPKGLAIDAKLGDATATAPPSAASRDTPRAGSKRKASALDSGAGAAAVESEGAVPSPRNAKAAAVATPTPVIGKAKDRTAGKDSSSSFPFSVTRGGKAAAKEAAAAEEEESPVRSSKRPRASTDLERDYVVDTGSKARAIRKEERERAAVATPQQKKETPKQEASGSKAPEPEREKRSTHGSAAREGEDGRTTRSGRRSTDRPTDRPT